MTQEEWKKTIKEQIKFDKNYIPSFDTTLQILSEMLAERDNVYNMYLESGARPVVEFTSDRGATNLKQNPLLKQWTELNQSALLYLRDLGLTPAGLRKLQGQLPKEREIKTSILDDIRASIGLTMRDPSYFEGVSADAIQKAEKNRKRKKPADMQT